MYEWYTLEGLTATEIGQELTTRYNNDGSGFQSMVYTGTDANGDSLYTLVLVHYVTQGV